jgi:hypothetical protein
MGLKKLVNYGNGNYPGKKCYHFLHIVEKSSYYLDSVILYTYIKDIGIFNFWSFPNESPQQ